MLLAFTQASGNLLFIYCPCLHIIHIIMNATYFTPSVSTFRKVAGVTRVLVDVLIFSLITC